jgi:hypothetical protein
VGEYIEANFVSTPTPFLMYKVRLDRGEFISLPMSTLYSPFLMKLINVFIYGLIIVHFNLLWLDSITM